MICKMQCIILTVKCLEKCDHQQRDLLEAPPLVQASSLPDPGSVSSAIEHSPGCSVSLEYGGRGRERGREGEREAEREGERKTGRGRGS